LTTILDESFPGLTLHVAHVNRTTNSEWGLDDRLTRLRDDIGDVAYTALLQANEDDLTLWQTVRSSYQA
jgi:hypothetical protein